MTDKATLMIKGVVPAGETKTIPSGPFVSTRTPKGHYAGPRTQPFNPTKVSLDKLTKSGAFTINDIRCGGKSQFTQPSLIPAEVFTDGAFGSEVQMDVLLPSQDLEMVVTNTSAVPANFLCWVEGHNVT